MATLFGCAAILVAVGASMASLDVLPWFHGLRWLRVHLITIGVLSEVAFGALPALVAAGAGRPRPGTRWDIWALLNVGLLCLMVGMPIINPPAIVTGGLLVLTATGLLAVQLHRLRAESPPIGQPSGRPFYLAGLAYLLVGALLGTGFWIGWSQALSVPSPKETHVHATLWGFLALIFAGLLVDLYAPLAGRPLARPRSMVKIFILMAVGAFGLVLGPWAEVHLLTAAGLLVHALGTAWLLVNALGPLRRARAPWTAALAQLFSAYVWFYVPVLLGPVVVLTSAGYAPSLRFASTELEGNGAPILVYGWALQFAFVVGPYLYSRAFFPDEPARAGGSWASMVASHLGVVCYALGMFWASARPLLHGAAYVLWILAAVPTALLLLAITREGFARRERMAR